MKIHDTYEQSCLMVTKNCRHPVSITGFTVIVDSSWLPGISLLYARLLCHVVHSD